MREGRFVEKEREDRHVLEWSRRWCSRERKENDNHWLISCQYNFLCGSDLLGEMIDQFVDSMSQETHSREKTPFLTNTTSKEIFPICGEEGERRQQMMTSTSVLHRDSKINSRSKWRQADSRNSCTKKFQQKKQLRMAWLEIGPFFSTVYARHLCLVKDRLSRRWMFNKWKILGLLIDNSVQKKRRRRSKQLIDSFFRK